LTRSSCWSSTIRRARHAIEMAIEEARRPSAEVDEVGPEHRSPVERLQQLNQESLHPAGMEAEARQHERGKLTARERLEQLLDPGSFVELDRFARHRNSSFGMEQRRPPGDGVVTGHGEIDGRTVFVFSQDFT